MKWVKSDSEFATGSSGRVSANIRSEKESKEKLEKRQAQQANPKGTKGGYGSKRVSK